MMADKKNVTLLRWWPQVLASIAILIIVMWLKYDEDNYHHQLSYATELEMDPYAELGIHRQATKADIKKAHRKLSLEWHPDRRSSCDEECHQKFKRINEAFRVLGNSERRRMYDDTAKIYHASSTKFNNNMHPFEFDLSDESWKRIVQPSLHGFQLAMDEHISGSWAILISDSTSEWTEHTLAMWSDLAARFYGRVSFMRADSRTFLHETLLPMRIQVPPAIMMLNPGDTPSLYTSFRSLRPNTLADWIAQGIPNHIHPYKGDLHGLRDKLQNGTLENDGRLPVVLATNHPPNSLIKAMAQRYWSLYKFYAVPLNSISLFVTDEAAYAPNAGVLLSHSSKMSKIMSVSLPKGIFTLDNMRFNREENLDNIQSTQAGKARKIIDAAMHTIASNNSLTAFAESFQWLCKNSPCSILHPESSAQPPTNITVKFPIKRLFATRSPLFRALSADKDVPIILDVKGSTFTINNEEKQVNDLATLFPQLRLRNWEQVIAWSASHPLVLVTLILSVYGTYYGLRVLLRWNYTRNKED